jgi:hypothetical protein
MVTWLNLEEGSSRWVPRSVVQAPFFRWGKAGDHSKSAAADAAALFFSGGASPVQYFFGSGPEKISGSLRSHNHAQQTVQIYKLWEFYNFQFNCKKQAIH